MHALFWNIALDSSFGLVNKITLRALLGQNLSLKIQRMRQILHTNYFAFLNNFMVYQVRDILKPLKLSNMSH